MSIVAMVDKEVLRARGGETEEETEVVAPVAPAVGALPPPAVSPPPAPAPAVPTTGAQPSPPAAPRAGDVPQTDAGGVVSSLVSYIPAEAIAAYLILYPFMDPSGDSYTGRWWLVAGIAVLALLYTIGYRALASLRNSQPFKLPLLALVTTLAGFAAWVFAIPGSPFNSLDFYTPELGAAAGSVVATAIAFVGSITEATLAYRAAAQENLATT